METEQKNKEQEALYGEITVVEFLDKVFRRSVFLIVQHKFAYEKDEKGNLCTIIKTEFASTDKSQDIDKI